MHEAGATGSLLSGAAKDNKDVWRFAWLAVLHRPVNECAENLRQAPNNGACFASNP